MAVNEELNDNLQRVYRQMLVFSDLAIQREQLTRSAFLAREPLEESREHVSEKDWPGASNDLTPFDREAWILDNGEKPVPDAAGASELKATIRRDVLIGIASGAILYVLLIIFAIGETMAAAHNLRRDIRSCPVPWAMAPTIFSWLVLVVPRR